MDCATPARHLYHKTIKAGSGNIAHLSNTRRSMSQVKEQQKFPEKELKDIDEMEATQKPGTESKIMIRRALQDLKGRMDDLSENLKR